MCSISYNIIFIFHNIYKYIVIYILFIIFAITIIDTYYGNQQQKKTRTA